LVGLALIGLGAGLGARVAGVWLVSLCQVARRPSVAPIETLHPIGSIATIPNLVSRSRDARAFRAPQ
jgi:hypothetical protein